VAVAAVDEKVIIVTAVPAHLRVTVRLVRALGLDGNPLRRGTDRAIAWIRVGVLVTLLIGAPLAAIGAAHWIHHAAVTEARTQATARHRVPAVLLRPTPAPAMTMGGSHWGGQVLALARWRDEGAARTGHVPADPGLPAGRTVTVWLDAAGRVTGPPLQPDQITGRTIAAGAAALAALALCLLMALWVAHRIADRLRLAAWERAWSRVGPQWTRRRP